MIHLPDRRIRERRLLSRRWTRLDGTWTGTVQSQIRRRDRNYCSHRCPRLATVNRPRRPARISRRQCRLWSGLRNKNSVCNRFQCYDQCCSGPPSPRRRLVCGMATWVYHWPQAFRESHFPFWNLYIMKTIKLLRNIMLIHKQ